MAPSTSAAAELVGEVRAKPASISERLASHPFVRALAAGEVSKTWLERFAGEQRSVSAGDGATTSPMTAYEGPEFLTDRPAGNHG